jgi:hypothetical protein
VLATSLRPPCRRLTAVAFSQPLEHSSNDFSRPSFHAARCRHLGPLRQAGRAGRARPRARRALHARRHRLALGKGAGAGLRIPSAFTPILTRHISGATNIGRFDASFRPKKSSLKTRPTRIQQRPVEMDASDSSEGSGKAGDDPGKRPISPVVQIHPCCASNPRVGGSNPSGRASVRAGQAVLPPASLPGASSPRGACAARLQFPSEGSVPLSHIGLGTCVSLSDPASGPGRQWPRYLRLTNCTVMENVWHFFCPRSPNLVDHRGAR